MKHTKQTTEIRTEVDEAIFVSARNAGTARVTRVKYRKRGSKGRWSTFVVQDKEPHELGDLHALVTQWEKAKGR